MTDPITTGDLTSFRMYDECGFLRRGAPPPLECRVTSNREDAYP